MHFPSIFNSEIRLISSLFYFSLFKQKYHYGNLKLLFVRTYIKSPKKFNPFRKRNPGFADEEDSKIASRICLTILGNGAIGQPRCLAMFTDKRNYLFNCGEGIGRLCREHEILLVDVRHVFITQKSWRNLSGVADIYLTNDAFGVRKINLHGPPGIEKFMNLVISTHNDVLIKRNSHLDSSYSDDNVDIEYVPIKQSYSSKQGKLRHDKVWHYNARNYSAEKEMNCNSTMSYICKVKEKPGEFMAEKCVEHNVPIGPLLLKLKNGEDVTLPSGKLVRPCDVHRETYPASVFLVVDCPSVNLLDSFVNEKRFALYHTPREQANEVDAVVHFSSPDVVNSNKYQQWMKRFHQNVYHVMVNSNNPTPSSAVIHKVQHVLHLLHPRIFGMIQERTKAVNLGNLTSSNVIYAHNLQQIHLRPIKKLDSSNVVQGTPEEYISNVKSMLNLNEDSKKLLEILKDKLNSVKVKDTYPEVLFLGTGSSTSSSTRNASGILVNTSAQNSILLDCGEGTFMQLVRSYGPNNINSILQKISCIFISHKHTDHYLGLFQLIKARKEAFHGSINLYQPLALVLPVPIEKAVKDFNNIFEPILSDVRIFPSHSLGTENQLLNSDLKSILKNIELSTVPVKHCHEAYGVVLKYGSKWKIVYSGDTSPCQRLVDAGKDCTLLIHETSIEDGLVNEASNKYHSTPSQVLDVSKRMNAKYTIMTHFSIRYLAIPVLDGCEDWHMGCAFDFMKVRLCDLPVLPYFLPILKYIFSDLLELHSERTTNTVSFENVFLRTLKSQL